jgi:hypothetical protein
MGGTTGHAATGLDEFGGLYCPPRTPVIVDVPPMDFLMVDGPAEARTSAGLAWAEAVDALRACAPATEGAGSPLEILWHGEPERSRWTVMIAVRGDRAPQPGTRTVHRRHLHEGWAAQLMANGGPDELTRALVALDRYIHDRGYRALPGVHQICLDDAAPAPQAPRRYILRKAVDLGA